MTSNPATVIDPELGLMMVAISLSAVVLPAPFGPSSVKMRPGWQVKLMSRRASIDVPLKPGPISRRCWRETENVFVRWSTTIMERLWMWIPSS